MDRTDRPEAAVTFLWILTNIQPCPRFTGTSFPSSDLKTVNMRGEKMTHSPVFRFEILSNQSIFVDSSSSGTKHFKCFHHGGAGGELKRWQITVEHSPIMSSGITVGSLVDTTVRIPRCHCCRMTLNIELMNGLETLFVRYWSVSKNLIRIFTLWASSNTSNFPVGMLASINSAEYRIRRPRRKHLWKDQSSR